MRVQNYRPQRMQVKSRLPKKRRFCMEMEQNPAYYAFGVLKHWARHC
jgi:hypothetical protein